MSFLQRKPQRFQSGSLKEQLSLRQLQALLDLLQRELIGDQVVNQVTRFGDRTVIGGENQLQGRPYAHDKFFSVIAESEDYLECSPYFFTSDNAWEPPHRFNQNSGPLGPIPSINQRVFVAKPYLLQKTPWVGPNPIVVGGITITYLYTDVGRRDAVGIVNGVAVIEDQYITPPYIPGEIIVARSLTTALKYPGPDPTLNDPEDPEYQVPSVITWQDTNEAGRCWAVDCTAEE